jgi:hypothetical protein
VARATFLRFPSKTRGFETKIRNKRALFDPSKSHFLTHKKPLSCPEKATFKSRVFASFLLTGASISHDSIERVNVSPAAVDPITSAAANLRFKKLFARETM